MPSFPEELREALLSSGLLERITNKKYKALIDKIHEEGPEAIEKEVEAIGRKQLIRSQTNYTLSTTRGALRTLTDLQKQIERRGMKENNGMVDFRDQIQTDQPEAMDINLKLYEALDASISMLNEAVDECEQRLQEFDADFEE